MTDHKLPKLLGTGALASLLFAVPALWLVLVGAGAIGLLTMFAALVARTTIYTITTKRVVIRFGIALPMTIQVSYPMIETAAWIASSTIARLRSMCLRSPMPCTTVDRPTAMYGATPAR